MPKADLGIPISAVEHETGIGKDTLRVWEKRYGFPTPSRNEAGKRCYADGQVNKLRFLRQLIDLGLRPAQLIHQSEEDLARRLKTAVGSQANKPPLTVDLQEMLAAVGAHASEVLRSRLKLALSSVGVRKFLTEFVEPLNVAIGDAWARGDLTIAEEHLYSEQMQVVLRYAIEMVPECRPHPRILLTTLPGEEHQLGLLMAQACLALEGAQCISLGIQTPIGEIHRAAVGHSVDIVGLSFGQSNRSREARDSLRALRSVLPADVQIWAGGKIWQQAHAQMAGISTISALTDIPGVVADWRARHPGPRSTRNSTCLEQAWPAA